MTISVSSSSQSQMQSQKKIGAMDKVPQQRLYDPGLYQLTKELQQPIKYEQKNTGFFGFVGKLVVGTIILGATAGLTRKYTSLSKLDLSAKAEKGLVKHLKYYWAKTGEFVNSKIVNNLISLFKKNPDDAK